MTDAVPALRLARAAQRLFALACACEHLNDHQALRTDPASAQVWTIRLKRLKIAARVKVSVRRVVISLVSSHPSLALFRLVAERLRGRRLTPE